MEKILALHNSHNASVCEIEDGKIIYFQEAERINRVKRSTDFSVLLHKYTNQSFDKIILVLHYEKIVQIEKLLEQFNITYKELIRTTQHHFFHACTAYYNSGFTDSYVLVADGNGSFIDDKYDEILSLYYFKNNKYKKIFQLYSIQDGNEYTSGRDTYLNTISLGEMYEQAKLICKYKEEGSVMGFSCYQRNKDNVDKLFSVKHKHFCLLSKQMYHLNFKHDLNICATVQKNLEEIIMTYVKNIIAGKKRNLCVSGGVFQNTVLNSKILDIVPDLHVDPFAEDSGLSMGAAMFYSKNKQKINNLYLGDLPNYNQILNKCFNITPAEVAKLISNKNVVAIFQGKNELGKRALGNRSFLYDPRDSFAKEKINLLKGREWFRPAAGTVLLEHANEWFDLKNKKETPYMSYVFKVKKNIPGITHIDQTCRIQTVTKQQNYHYYNLIHEFYKQTDVPILLNTSFNLAGQPLINSINDVMHLFESKNNDRASGRWYSENFNYVYFPEIGKMYCHEN